MDKITTLSELRTQANRLEQKFNLSPRLFDREAWENLVADYAEIGAVSNAAHWRDKLRNVDSLLRMEHTPMVPGDDTPWQLEEDRQGKPAAPPVKVRDDMDDQYLYWTGRSDIDQ